MIRDAIAILLGLAGWYAVWCALPCHAADLAPVQPTAAGDWLFASFVWIVGAVGIWLLCGRARTNGDGA